MKAWGDLATLELAFLSVQSVSDAQSRLDTQLRTAEDSGLLDYLPCLEEGIVQTIALTEIMQYIIMGGGVVL